MTSSTLFWLAAYALAMGYLESAVVVYLRLLYYPQGFVVGGVVLPPYTLRVEMVREAATIIMIGAVSLLSAGRLWRNGIAAFLYIFGIWDISYYIFLKILLGWPESLMTTDVYFLIPVPWVGPVVVPVLCSIAIILLSFALTMRGASSEK